MSDPNPSIKYFANLDVLRFILALFVVLFHVPEISKNSSLPFFNDLPLFNRGTEAVYWFFVLSGFLLSHLANKETKSNKFNVLKFFQRRVLRIWPVYFAVSLFGLLFYYAILPLLHIPFLNHANFGTAFLLQCFFLSNVLHAFYDPGGILTITWSVSVEEQFYLFFPLFVYLVYHKVFLKRVAVLALFILIICIYVFLPFFGELLQRLGLYIELFLIGIIAAEFFEAVKRCNSRTKFLWMGLSIVLFFLLFFTDLLLMPSYPFLWRLVNGLSASLFILILASWHRQCSPGWLVTGGKISYGIYMYHMIVITGLIFIFQRLSFQGTLVIVSINLLSIIFTYLLSLFSYRFFESRFLKMKKY